MKRLKIFEKDLNSCSRCGLCQGVCPIFNLTKNDCTSPRGKVIMLNELLKNNSKPSSKLNQYMKMCLNCGKCFDYCPGKIDIIKINDAFNRDFPFFSLKFLFKIPFLVKALFAFMHNKVPEKTVKKISKDKIIVYLRDYRDKKVPKIIEELNGIIIESCIVPINFAIENSKLYDDLSTKYAEEILEYNPYLIITNNPLCKLEAENGLKNLKIKKSVKIL